MALDSIGSLVVAVFELKAVQAVTKAINANLPKDGPLGTIRPSSAQLNPRPRKYYDQTPQPHVMPRPVMHPTPRMHTAGDYYDRSTVGNGAPSAASEASGPWSLGEGCACKKSESPLVAPWKHLPPVAEGRVDLVVNLVRPKVDIISKGSLLDLYV